MPHKFFGHSMADRVSDIQKIKTTITRQMLDNLYLSNNARMAVVDGASQRRRYVDRYTGWDRAR